jgi:hypothetical protein
MIHRALRSVIYALAYRPLVLDGRSSPSIVRPTVLHTGILACQWWVVATIRQAYNQCGNSRAAVPKVYNKTTQIYTLNDLQSEDIFQN